MLFSMVNRSMMSRLMRGLVFFIGSMLLAGACIWGVCWVDSWWLSLFWMLVVSIVLAVLIHGKVSRLSTSLLWKAVIPSVLAGMIVSVGVILLSLWRGSNTALFVSLVAIMAGHLYIALPATLQAFMGSLRHTKEHIIYMKSNGATHMESMMPSIVRGLRAAVLPLLRSWISPMVITLPLLLCGLLMAGTDIPLAVLLTVLTTLAAFVGVVSAAVVLIWLVDLWK